MKLNSEVQSPAGGVEKSQQLKDNGLLGNQKSSIHAATDQVSFGKRMPLETVAGSTMNSRHCGDKVAKEQTLKEEISVSGSPVVKSEKQLKVNLPSESDLEEIGAELDNQGRFSTVSIPRYLHLEPSLAMDWLEISWDELRIKERVGAGTSLRPSYLEINRHHLSFSLSILKIGSLRR